MHNISEEMGGGHPQINTYHMKRNRTTNISVYVHNNTTFSDTRLQPASDFIWCVTISNWQLYGTDSLLWVGHATP